MTEKTLILPGNVEPKRDAYGFSVRPQHLQRYKEYTDIYKEEEEERSSKWKYFLEQHLESAQPGFSKEHINIPDAESAEEKVEVDLKKEIEVVDLCNKNLSYDDSTIEGDIGMFVSGEIKSRKSKKWDLTRSSIGVIEKMMSLRINRSSMNCDPSKQIHLQSIQEAVPLGDRNGDDSEDDYFEDMLDESLNNSPQSLNNSSQGSPTCDVVFSPEASFPWKELEFLVHGGVPRGIRGEVWQAFVGVRTRRVDGYYQDLLVPVINMGEFKNPNNSLADKDNAKLLAQCVGVPEKWGKQIEKDLPRTFPGHPALGEDGRHSLRRLLLAYARHNPKVGYCQAMNFFAGLILLMMPEENAFWALVGIIDDYFDGYYSEEMIESQVDQLVFEELMRERFPKLVHHLDYLGVEVAWLSGPWFLTIFVNILPWESVLRVWDVLLFEGNRAMLFRTALALMELYGPALVTTKDAGDAVTLLQSLTGSTFDSSQLVLTACVGFMGVTETRLQELREKHRPTVLEAARERKKGGLFSKSSKGLASKLYSFKHDPQSIITETNTEERLGPMIMNANVPLSQSVSTDFDKFLSSIAVNSEVESIPDLQDQVVWLKVEMCKLLEEKRSATLRAEELETALMEMVKQDNRRQLSARVEQLEQQLGELQHAIADKREQETAMLQVLLRVEQEQRVTEDARLSAEQDVAAQKYAVHVLQEKHEKAMASIAEMEKRVVMAESMLEATLQYESSQAKSTHSSPRFARPDTAHPSNKTGLLSMPFVLGWRDKNKGKLGDSPQPAKNVDGEGEHKV